MKKQAGFTLIELIMVIVILGILSAFALPRFADLSDNAADAAVEGALASVKSSSAILHASALANNANTATGNLVVEGVNIAVVNGYPDAGGVGAASGADAANAAGISNAANLDTDFVVIYSNGTEYDDGATAAEQAAATTLIVTSSPITVGAPCFTYTESAAVNSAPTFSAVSDLGGVATDYTCP